MNRTTSLRQAGRPLHAVLGRTPQPTAFVVSMHLDPPERLAPVTELLARYPTTRFKLDAFAAWDEGDLERALDLLQREVGDEQDPARRDRLRAVMVAIFTELGPESELARTHRRRLAAVL